MRGTIRTNGITRGYKETRQVMKIKMFEEFDQVPKRFLFYVLDPGVEFKGEVRDEDGKVIYEVTREKIEEKGVMNNATDLSTLREYLIKRKKMAQIDELVAAENTDTNDATNPGGQ